MRFTNSFVPTQFAKINLLPRSVSGEQQPTTLSFLSGPGNDKVELALETITRKFRQTGAILLGNDAEQWFS